jgi:hypothetical protein
MLQAPDGQVSLTDPDARSMATSGRGTGMVGYNVQTAVDTKHHMIVAHEVTNVGHDREQLSPMSHQTSDAIDEKDLTVLADRGYYKGQQIYACEQAKPRPSSWPRPLPGRSSPNRRRTNRQYHRLPHRGPRRSLQVRPQSPEPPPVRSTIA